MCPDERFHGYNRRLSQIRNASRSLKIPGERRGLLCWGYCFWWALQFLVEVDQIFTHAARFFIVIRWFRRVNPSSAKMNNCNECFCLYVLLFKSKTIEEVWKCHSVVMPTCQHRFNFVASGSIYIRYICILLLLSESSHIWRKKNNVVLKRNND